MGAMDTLKALELITHPCNCVLRHHICPDGVNYHTSGTGGNVIFEACVRQIVAYEGLGQVSAWLMSMMPHFKVAASEAIMRIGSIEGLR